MNKPPTVFDVIQSYNKSSSTLKNPVITYYNPKKNKSKNPQSEEIINIYNNNPQQKITINLYDNSQKIEICECISNNIKYFPPNNNVMNDADLFNLYSQIYQPKIDHKDLLNIYQPTINGIDKKKYFYGNYLINSFGYANTITGQKSNLKIFIRDRYISKETEIERKSYKNDKKGTRILLIKKDKKNINYTIDELTINCHIENIDKNDLLEKIRNSNVFSIFLDKEKKCSINYTNRGYYKIIIHDIVNLTITSREINKEKLENMFKGFFV